MAQQILPAAVVCEAALEFEFAGGLFYVTDPTLGARKVMRPAEMQETIARAAICYRAFREQQSAEIIKFPDAHAASS
jgi:hypothetical protein